MNNSAAAVCVRQLSRRFRMQKKRFVTALDSVSFTLPYGGIHALAGADGAGKTTLLRTLCGLLPVTEGHVTVLGLDVARQPQAVQNRIAYMPQRFGLYDDLSAAENLQLYAGMHQVPRQRAAQRIQYLLAMTGLAPFAARSAGKLSGGMKQKLALACTLVRAPELLLLDEPTVGVDPLSRHELWQIIRQLTVDEPLTVLFATTDMEEAAQAAQITILHQGRLLARGTPGMISGLADGACYTVIPRAGEAVRTLQAALYDAHDLVVDAVPQAGSVRLVLAARATPAQLSAQIGGRCCMPVSARVEDGFMCLLRQQAQRIEGIDYRQPPKAGYDPDQTVIRVNSLCRVFGDFVAVDNTSFVIRRGEIFGLLGPNGAGKTTIFRMLCGLLPASGGELEVAGADLRRAKASARRPIAYVAQKFALYGTLSVRENLCFFGRAYGLRGGMLKQRIDVLCQAFALQDCLDSVCGVLPHGFRQRLAVAAALLHEPEILFLDEPTSGSDVVARREFWRCITALAAAGTTVVVTTHFMEEAEYCDRVLIQDQGRTLALGSSDDVRRQAGGADGEAALTMAQAFMGIVQRQRQAQGAAVPSRERGCQCR